MSSNDEDIAKLYEALPKENPPTHLDEAVLKFARKNTPLRAKGWLGFFAWSLPVAMTASLFFLLQSKPETPPLLAQANLPSPGAPPKMETAPAPQEPSAPKIQPIAEGKFGKKQAPAKELARGKSKSAPKTAALEDAETMGDDGVLGQAGSQGWSGEQDSLGMGGLGTRGAGARPPPAPAGLRQETTVAPQSALPYPAQEACNKLPRFSQLTSCTLELAHAAGWTLRLNLELFDGGANLFDADLNHWLRSLNFSPQAPNDFTRELPHARERLQVERNSDTVKLKWTFMKSAH